jgi:Tol biopolymer transport system component
MKYNLFDMLFKERSTRDGNLEIYLMNGNGSNQTGLTNNTAVEDFP